jgi:ankyrin repeat protein
VEKALHVLPLGLDATYIRALDEIDSQPSYIRTVALKTLMWTIYAERPLMTEEVKHALATDRLCNSTEDVELDTSEVILGACANLLAEHRDMWWTWTSGFRLVHYSVQEFFRESPKAILGGRCMDKIEDKSHIHSQLAITCLSHLQCRILEGPCQESFDLKLRVDGNPFVWYAACSFDHHIMSCGNLSDQLRQHISKFLGQEDWFLTAVLQLRAVRPGPRDPRGPNPYADFNPYHSLASMSTMVYGTRLYNVPDLQDQWKVLQPPSFGLHEACSAGSANAVARLLVDGHDFNERSSAGIAPLYYAASRGHLSIARMLLEKGADADMQGGYHGSALQAASSTGHKAIVSLVVDHSPNAALKVASDGGDMEKMELLIKNGADVNLQDRDGETPLFAALEDARTEVGKLLINHGADIHARNKEFTTALMKASAWGAEDMVELLLSKGADINASNVTNETALHGAARNGEQNVVELLISKGANIHARNIKKETALHLAAELGWYDVVELLISKGADIHAQGERGTALQMASEAASDVLFLGRKDTIELLLAKGAKYDGKTLEDESSHEQALPGACNTDEVVELTEPSNAESDETETSNVNTPA